MGETPSVEANLDQNSQKILGQMIEAAKKTDAPFSLILDIDETLVGTEEARRKLLKRHRGIYGDEDKDFPDRDEIIRGGGIKKVYPELFKDEAKREEANDRIQRMRTKAPTYRRAEPLSHSISDVLRSIESEVEVIGYLSARFYSPAMAGVTRESLSKMNLPLKPMILRQPDLPMNEEGKIAFIEEIIEASRKPVIIIDDKASLADYIKKRNEANPEKPPIIQIVFMNPVTRQQIESSSLTEDPKSGIYFAEDWDSMSGVVKKAIKDHTF